jgi:uncharacterized protein (DUF58 family)
VAITFEELFDAKFLESLAHLRLVAKRVPAGGRFAEQRSHDKGHGLEFRDFRPYSSGDDLRAVDWNIYRRLGRVFIRLFEELEDLPLYLLPDNSKSAYMEESPRIRASLRAALAMASISLAQHDTVGVFPFSDDLTVLERPRSGRGRLMSYAKHMSELKPGGATNIPQALKRFGAMQLRPGLCVILSDFFDPAGIEAVVKAMGKLRHRLLLVQLVKGSDRNPDLQGDLQLRDCETGSVEDVSVTPQVLESYRTAYDRFELGLTEFASGRNAGLLRLDTDSDVVPQLATLFESGNYSV